MCRYIYIILILKILPNNHHFFEKNIRICKVTPVNMLEFENQMLLDILNEDGLLVAARGLGLDQVFHSLIKVYSDEGNLVFVIGASPTEEEHCLAQMLLGGVSPLPRVISSEVQVYEREGFYMGGGVIFVSARILVVDLLKGRVPLDHVTGFLVCRAHRILESCQEAFALRLFRQGNKTGFVKSFSNCPEAFTVGFARVERVMRALFARNLQLWPRFHATVVSSLAQKKPLLVELHLELSPLMQQIQCALLDLLNFTVKELKRINPLLDTEEFTVENAVSHLFARHLRTQVDPIWHQLSLKSRQLLSDLKTLAFILRALTQYDCVTFETLVAPLHSMEYAMRSSGWPLLDAAETLFVSSRARVDRLHVKERKEKANKKAKLDDDEENGKKRIPVLEVSPKWVALSEALKEMQMSSIGNDIPKHSVLKVLIRVADARTSNLLMQYLTIGHQALLSRLYQKACKENKLGGSKLYTGAMGIDEAKDRCDIMKEQVSMMDVLPVMSDEGTTENKTSESEAVVGDSEKQDGTFTFTLSQKNDLNDLKLKGDSSQTKSPELVSKRDVEIIIVPTKGKDPNIFGRTLTSVHPHYVVIYDADISAIRQIEVYQSYNPDFPPRVYFLMYRGSVEEQAYLTALRKEKESFELLIQQKASMVVPEEREGRFDDKGHPELDRDLGKSAMEASGLAEAGSGAGRKGGGRVQSCDSKCRSKVIVDMREFSSELPSIIHRRGMDVEPITLSVGDYILTKDICVERKSLSDLIGSLQSGRLYNQATAMTRHYAQPILLIEFDKDKPFVLQGKFYVSIDGRNTDVASRLQLLTLHFPRLRLVWSPSPYATAELFEELKQGRQEPSAEEAAVAGLDKTSSKLSHCSAPVKFNPEIEDFIIKLPGVSTKNVHYLLNKTKSLDHLMTLTQSALSSVLGNDKNGEALWRALHHPLRSDGSASLLNSKGKKLFRRKGQAK